MDDPRSPAPVSIVIVTWHSAEHIGPCLRSIAALVRRPEAVIVVDNGSTDETVEIVRCTAPGVTMLPLGSNTGFCHAANRGIGETESRFVLLLNPDTRLEPTFLEEILPAFEDPRVGLAGGKILRFDGLTIDSAGQSLGRSRQPIDRGYGKRDAGQFDSDEEVFGICGAAVVYRREMIASVSRTSGEFFDPTFFAFYEDLDVAWRARKLGWMAAYRHRAVAYHLRGGTAGSSGVRRRGAALLHRPPDLRFHIVKNRFLVMLRNDRLGDYLRDLPFILARDLAVASILCVASPTVLLRLAKSTRLVRRALDLRRRDRALRAAFPTPG